MLDSFIRSIIRSLNPFTRFERRARRAVRPFKQVRRYKKSSYTYVRRKKKHSSRKANALTEAEIREKIQDLPSFQVTRILDGDTVIVSNGWSNIRIRLDSIDCPEDGQDWGDTAKYGLIKLIGGQQVRLEEHGIDIHGRVLATLYVWNNQKNEWMNVNERMVTLGHAWVMRRFYNHLPKDRQDKLNRLERWAKSKNIGLWRAPDPVPPWTWRNGG